MSAPELGYLDLALGGGLVLLDAGLCLLLSIGLARSIFIAMVRAFVQLLLVGFVLRFVFSLGSPPVIGALVCVMICAATYEIGARQERPLAGIWRYGLGGSVMALATAGAVAYALATHIRPDPWYDPRFLVPLVGIVLGSVMSAISLGLNSLSSTIARERVTIESRLALGATRFEALRPLIRSAVRAGLIPILNQMAAAGLITLPGMMSGQILAGMSPQSAAKYQILILFLLAGASGIGVIGSVYAAAHRLTDARHRLRLDRLAKPAGASGKR